MTAVAPESSARDVLGRAALVVGIVGILVGAAATLVQPALIRGGGIPAIQVLGLARLVLVALIGLAAIVLGLVALLRRRPGTPSAAAGTTLGAVLLVDVLVGAITPLLYTLAS